MKDNHGSFLEGVVTGNSNHADSLVKRAMQGGCNNETP